MNARRMFTSFGGVVAGTALLSYLSAVPIAYHPTGSARLRLSWSARPERIEVCRTLSEAELARLEEHMQQRVSCDGVFATYTLRVEVDSRVVSESVVRGAGLRHDRPLYLLREYAVPPGSHRFRVSLTRREQGGDTAAAQATAIVSDVDAGLYAGRAAREISERARRASAAIPAHLRLDTVLNLAPHRVALVTYDTERRALRLRAGAAQR